ncbi:hypothetical protein GP486_006959 [Trichoglossum hirsutum]|uniref:Uncharacterized protein n=1 Tax=Trichoglossum hirsutum TaxID=265104 RepID=A0A9P8IGG6_9PEZI|nr:hypothetical protein GP486_006959 [Trichoglossum hirsutum]
MAMTRMGTIETAETAMYRGKGAVNAAENAMISIVAVMGLSKPRVMSASEAGQHATIIFGPGIESSWEKMQESWEKMQDAWGAKLGEWMVMRKRPYSVDVVGLVVATREFRADVERLRAVLEQRVESADKSSLMKEEMELVGGVIKILGKKVDDFAEAAVTFERTVAMASVGGLTVVDRLGSNTHLFTSHFLPVNFFACPSSLLRASKGQQQQKQPVSKHTEDSTATTMTTVREATTTVVNTAGEAAIVAARVAATAAAAVARTTPEEALIRGLWERVFGRELETCRQNLQTGSWKIAKPAMAEERGHRSGHGRAYTGAGMRKIMEAIQVFGEDAEQFKATMEGEIRAIKRGALSRAQRGEIGAAMAKFDKAVEEFRAAAEGLEAVVRV